MSGRNFINKTHRLSSCQTGTRCTPVGRIKGTDGDHETRDAAATIPTNA
jgi:hypothetical protein